MRVGVCCTGARPRHALRRPGQRGAHLPPCRPSLPAAPRPAASPPPADSDDEGEDGKTAVSGPSREQMYSAFHKGTVSSKKKKQARGGVGVGLP